MENVFTVSQPFLIYAKTLGLFPKSFEGKATNGVFKTQLRDVLISCCSLCLVLALNVMNFYWSVPASTGSRILNIVWNLFADLEISLYILLFIYQIWKRKNILTFLKLIMKCDEMVSQGIKSQKKL